MKLQINFLFNINKWSARIQTQITKSLFLYIYIYIYSEQRNKCTYRKKNIHRRTMYTTKYNLLTLLYLTMAIEWNCGVSLYQNSFLSPLCVCLFFQKKKKKTLLCLKSQLILKFQTNLTFTFKKDTNKTNLIINY